MSKATKFKNFDFSAISFVDIAKLVDKVESIIDKITPKKIIN